MEHRVDLYYDDITDGAELAAAHAREMRSLEERRSRLKSDLIRCLHAAKKSKPTRRAAVTLEFKAALAEHDQRLRNIFGAVRAHEKAYNRALSKVTREVRREVAWRTPSVQAAFVEDMKAIASNSPLPMTLSDYDVSYATTHREVVIPVKEKYGLSELEAEWVRARRELPKLLEEARSKFWIHQRYLKRHLGSLCEETRRIPLIREALRDIHEEATIRQRDLIFHQKVHNLRAIHLEARLREVEPLPEIVLPLLLP